MTHLFAALFFAATLVLCVAMLIELWREHKALVLANLPWRSRQAQEPMLPPARGRGAAARRSYCATPSISSDTPRRAITVSPAMVR